MFYVIAGIIVLVVSFVVALISLVYEQREVEGRMDDSEENEAVVEAGSGASGLGPIATPDMGSGSVGLDQAELASLGPGTGLLYPQVDVGVTQHGVPVAALGLVNRTAIQDDHQDGDLWWSKLTAGSSGRGNILGDSEEQKSIRAIQEELARLTAKKSGLGGQQDTNVENSGLVDYVKNRESDRLSGEFSLENISKDSK